MFTQSTGQSRKEKVLTHRLAEYPTYSPVRAQMNYQLHYDRLIERARSRVKPGGYTERHHAIPRCFGGKLGKNLVHLTAREHYVAHLLLAKIYGGEMWRAICGMSERLNLRKSRMYEHARVEVANLASIVGTNNYRAKVGIHDPKNLGSGGRENARLNKEDKRGIFADGMSSKAGTRAFELKKGLHAPGMASILGKRGGSLPHWYNPKTGEHVRRKERPSEDFINSSGPRRKKHAN